VANDSVAQPPGEFMCRPCLVEGVVRWAWTVIGGDATCVRHTVEATTMDDMEQHDLLVIVYEKLRQMGFPNVY